MIKYTILLFAIFANLYSQGTKEFTLEDAIKSSKKVSYLEKNIQEDIKTDKLNLSFGENFYKPSIYLKLQLGQEENAFKTVNDSFVYLELKSLLYSNDISILNDEFKNNIKVKQILLDYSIKKRKIKTMRLYFDALLTYGAKQYALEVLAMKAIRNFRANDYYNAGGVSDITILETKTAMQFASAKKAQADDNYENTRLKLAKYLDEKIEKVYHLKNPNLSKYWKKKIPEEEELYKLALKNDLKLKSINKKLTNINQKLFNQKDLMNLKIGATLKYGSEPQKMLDENDARWEARVNLSLAVFDDDLSSKKVSILQIQRNKILNELEQYKLDLKQSTYNAMLEVKKYKKLYEAYETQVDYRNLYLERARVNYELDKQSDLGDSMVELTLAEYEFAKNEYNYVIAYEMLELIIGENK